MAKVVLGIGSSHSPALLMKPSGGWPAARPTTRPSWRCSNDFDGYRIKYE